ncbi:TPA: hypothetical protein ACSJ8I_001531 [Escherichia coli]|uniref:Uncharacterized protein n=1 Tax=Enterobacter asburiae TaxID=61645 RepID=A0AAW7ZZK9_ENTAS|nr:MULTISPECIES: hypothetical protein [Enterobacter cloacae complex]MBJ6585255.1 hypothetical protein [Enterobacter asburiae]MCL8161675.1 hypothetical protein [Enterobacter asburiae]MCM7939344.1 hypothetical protein [Enterobacter asburiae]MDO7925103.1 hypothetical protein [Enterobacter asburiae]MDV0911583.1 hypothetical protein [Enterobacter asburiae]
MKKITAYLSLSLLIIPFAAQSQSLAKWVYPNGIPTLKQDSRGMDDFEFALAVTNSSTGQVSILDFRPNTDAESSCYGIHEYSNPKIRDISPAKIAGKYVKMISICLGQSSGIIQPKTEEGKRYFNGLVFTGAPVDIYLSDTKLISFPASDTDSMKKKLSELNSAM